MKPKPNRFRESFSRGHMSLITFEFNTAFQANPLPADKNKRSLLPELYPNVPNRRKFTVLHVLKIADLVREWERHLTTARPLKIPIYGIFDSRAVATNVPVLLLDQAIQHTIQLDQAMQHAFAFTLYHIAMSHDHKDWEV